LISVVAAALWLFSSFCLAVVGRIGANSIYLRSEYGRPTLYFQQSDADDPRGWFLHVYPQTPALTGPDFGGWWTNGGIGYGVGGSRDGHPVYAYIFPYWPIVLAGLPLPAYRFARRRGRRTRPGHCAVCNYNLTANTSGVCPECGTTQPQVKA
jgi:hypothetical protein